MNYVEYFKPLLSFRKYWMAHRVLKVIGNPTIWLCDPKTGIRDQNGDINGISVSRYDYNHLVKHHFPENNPVRILSAINMLEKNKHAAKIQTESFKDFGIFCTKEGLEALDDGFYIKKVYLFFVGIIGAPLSITGILKIIGVL